MTFKEFVLKYLTDNGMFPDQAEAVFENLKNDSASEPMQGRWNDNVEGYPSIIKIGILLPLNKLALEWIDKNKPKAWFRPMFDKEQLDKIMEKK